MSITCPVKRSPWGNIQNAVEVCNGVWLVSTSTHGGVFVELKRLKDMKGLASYGMKSSKGRWYEEDCDWALPAFALHDFPVKYKELSEATFKNHNPDIWEEYTGQKVKASESHIVQQREWDEKNKGNKKIRACWGDWHEKVKEGFVAALIGFPIFDPHKLGQISEPEYLLIPEDEYKGFQTNNGSYIPRDHSFEVLNDFVA